MTKPSPGTSSTPAIVLLTGELRGQRYDVADDIVVGRGNDCSVFLPDGRLSRKHARFFLDGKALVVEDLGSQNGTTVNGERITRRVLARGDVVRMGESEFRAELHVASRTLQLTPVQLVGDERSLRPEIIKPVPQGGSPTIDAKLPDSARYFATLFDLSRAIQREHDTPTMLARAMDLVLPAVGADRGFVVLRDADGKLAARAVRFRAADGTALEGSAADPIDLSRTVAYRVLDERCGVLSRDTRTDARFAGAASIAASGVRALMAAPIVLGNRVLGLLEVESHDALATAPFSERDLDLLTVVASLLGVALDNLAQTEARERTITALESAQKQLLATQQQLVRAEQLAVVGRLASGIAHEVKNQLSPFMLADMIAARYGQDREIQAATELMLDAQRAILGLVNEVRNFASGAQGNGAEEFAPTDLEALVEGVLRFVQCDATVKRARVTFEPHGTSVIAEIDANRVRQVLINLLRNAADAVAATRGQIVIRVRADHESATIEVEDNGTGIPANLAERVFEPFFSTKGEAGLGLGLDISRNIVNAHGGSLTFTSREGQGTTFRVTLPIVRAAKLASPA